MEEGERHSYKARMPTTRMATENPTPAFHHRGVSGMRQAYPVRAAILIGRGRSGALPRGVPREAARPPEAEHVDQHAAEQRDGHQRHEQEHVHTNRYTGPPGPSRPPR